MTPDLRSQMHRLADAVEPLPVDDDLWQRGVAARRRGQALVVAAVLAIIASVTWSAVLLDTDGREARTASTEVVEGGAIPRVITDVPPDLETTQVGDLDLGRASAAFNTENGDAVVITAEDGVPHRLDLVSRDDDSYVLALSPDGTRLAFQEDPGSGDTYVAVLDLQTGRTDRTVVQTGDTLHLNDISWSPNGDWLAWVASRIGDTPSWAGTLRPSGAEGHRFVPSFNAVSAAVADDGTLALGSVGGGLHLSVDDRELAPVTTDVQAAPSRFSPDGSFLALASAPGTASYTLDTDSRQVLVHPFPDDTFGMAVARPLGWIDDRVQLLLVQDAEGGELVVTTPQVDDTSTWRRSVGEVDAAVASSLTLAVDLVPDLDGTPSQQLTRDFPPPAERDISWIIGLGVAAAIAVLMALRWLWRRLLG